MKCAAWKWPISDKDNSIISLLMVQKLKDYNHSLIQFLMLYKAFVAVSAAALLSACTPENNSGSKNNSDELVVTGDAMHITPYSVMFTGYANLPLAFGDAVVGIMYDDKDSFIDNKKLLATELDGNNMFTVSTTGLKPSTTYYFKSFVQSGMAVQYGQVKSFMTDGTPVDMGTVTSEGKKLYWARSNLSEKGLCANPEEYGDYYAWGETETKLSPNWLNYKFSKSSTGPFSKYNTRESYGPVDNIATLDSGPDGDDVASRKLGGKWRMPTYGEWDELRTKCKWTWTDSYNETGVKGLIVTAQNGNSIFFPAAGHLAGRDPEYARIFGFYWSSSLYVGKPNRAGSVDIRDDGIFWSDEYRYCGLSIRPVSE